MCSFRALSFGFCGVIGAVLISAAAEAQPLRLIYFASPWGSPGAVTIDETMEEAGGLPVSESESIELAVGLQKFKPSWGTLQTADIDAAGTGFYSWNFSDPSHWLGFFDIVGASVGVELQGQTIDLSIGDGVSTDVGSAGWSVGDPLEGSLEVSMSGSVGASPGNVVGEGLMLFAQRQDLLISGSRDSDLDGDFDADDVVKGGLNGVSSGFVGVLYSFFPSINAPVGGDSDLDGDVDGFDLGIWQTNVGRSGPDVGWNHGDWDQDGDVDSFDLGIWQINQGSGSSVQNIPEPAGGAMLVSGFSVLSILRRRWRLS